MTQFDFVSTGITYSKSSYNKYFFRIFLNSVKAGSQLFRISVSVFLPLSVSASTSFPASRLIKLFLRKKESFWGNKLYASINHFN